MNKPSVFVEDVSKKFSITLNSALKYGMIDSVRRSIGLAKQEALRVGEFWALSNVSFELNPGDALGIMGVNGSGKTTLLRILNGTYSPDKGKVTIRGRLGALIAAGAGFSPMLSGRENVYISATLLGMNPTLIKSKFDEIVAFAGIEEFIDMPVRNYSSGMAVRLGFSIAVLGQPEVLLVDEVLAVGDIAFQKKCYERIYQLRNDGVTILLVSHSPGAIWAVCNKGLVLSGGKSSGVLSVESTCKLYDDYNISAQQKAMQDGKAKRDISGEFQGGTGDVLVTDFTIYTSLGLPQQTIVFAESFLIKVVVQVINKVSNGILRISISSAVHKGIAVLDSYEQESVLYDLLPGIYEFEVRVQMQNFRPGTYSLSCAVISKDYPIMLYYDFNAGEFSIMNTSDRFFYAYDTAYMYIPATFSLCPRNM